MKQPPRRSFLKAVAGVGICPTNPLSGAAAAPTQATPDPLLTLPPNLPVPIDDGA